MFNYFTKSSYNQKPAQNGQALVEYAVLFALISVATIIVLVTLGGRVGNTFKDITCTINNSSCSTEVAMAEPANTENTQGNETDTNPPANTNDSVDENTNPDETDNEADENTPVEPAQEDDNNSGNNTPPSGGNSGDGNTTPPENNTVYEDFSNDNNNDTSNNSSTGSNPSGGSDTTPPTDNNDESNNPPPAENTPISNESRDTISGSECDVNQINDESLISMETDFETITTATTLVADLITLPVLGDDDGVLGTGIGAGGLGDLFDGGDQGFHAVRVCFTIAEAGTFHLRGNVTSSNGLVDALWLGINGQVGLPLPQGTLSLTVYVPNDGSQLNDLALVAGD